MKVKLKYFYCIAFNLVILFTSCNVFEDNNCYSSNKKTVTKELIPNSFDQIIVNNQIKLYIKESPIHKVVIETSENLLDHIEIEVTNHLLEISENISCTNNNNLTTTKVYVYAPNITKIRNSSVQSVNSLDILNYPNLELISENYQSEYLNSGDFILKLNSQNLRIVANGTSTYKLDGYTENLNINFAGNNPRLEGEHLTTNNTYVFGRSANDILIKVNNEISGELHSTGDVILFKKPNKMNLKTRYIGKVIHNY